MNYKITCKKCNGSSKLYINNGVVTYIDHLPIISSRFRSDLKWGFECSCGNDSRISKQEYSQANLLIRGSSKQGVKAVIDRIKESGEDSFIMEKI